MLSKEIFWILALAVCTSYFAVAPVKTLATHQDGFGDQTEDSKQAIGHDANYGLYDPELVFVVVTGGGNLYPQVDSAIDSGFILSAKPLNFTALSNGNGNDNSAVRFLFPDGVPGKMLSTINSNRVVGFDDTTGSWSANLYPGSDSAALVQAGETDGINIGVNGHFIEPSAPEDKLRRITGRYFIDTSDQNIVDPYSWHLMEINATAVPISVILPDL